MRHEDSPMRNQGEFAEPIVKRSSFFDRFEDESNRLLALLIVGMSLVFFCIIGGVSTCNIVTSNQSSKVEIERIEAYRERTKVLQTTAENQGDGTLILIEQDLREFPRNN